jgi:transcriptional regulator with XRE-family HTH domain
LASLRKNQGLTQAALAARLGVARSTVARWEASIDPIAPASVPRLSALLGVRPEQFGRPVRRLPIPGLPAPSLFAPPYPVKGTLADMLRLGNVAEYVYATAHLPAATDLEIESRLPRDTEHELLAAYHFLTLPARLEFWSCDELTCPLLITGTRTWGSGGHLRRHTLVVQNGESTVLLQPQVTVALIAQSRRYRMDFLATRVSNAGVAFADIEIDGKYHEDTADADARRAFGLGIPTLRYSNTALLRTGFGQTVLRDLASLNA